MLVCEIKETNRPLFMIAFEEIVRIIHALIDNRYKFVLRRHHLKLVEKFEPLQILGRFIGFRVRLQIFERIILVLDFFVSFKCAYLP